MSSQPNQNKDFLRSAHTGMQETCDLESLEKKLPPPMVACLERGFPE